MSSVESPQIAPTPSADLEQLFQELAARWRKDAAHYSSITEKAMHPAYQRIIGLGPAALPLILHDLEREPDHWFWALRAITGEDPVPREDRGKIGKMAETWLAFARERGYM